MQTPWYKQPLVWMLIAIPMSAVIAGGVTIWLAITTSDGLVVDDYYKQGLAINQVLRRDLRASDYQLEATLNIVPEQGLVRLDLNKGVLPDYPERLQMSLRHATSDDSDVSIELIHGMQSQYIGYMKQSLPAGAWYIELGNDDWRLNARSRLEDLGVVKLQAESPAN
ncbi:MAG: FixH family protein [Gammaproteobacteria bacterium]